MNTFYFLLVLMTVKGTKCEFDWLKNVHEMKKSHNAVYYLFSSQCCQSCRAMQSNAPILFTQIHADLHVVRVASLISLLMITYGSY